MTLALQYAGFDLSPKTPAFAAILDRWWVEEAPTLWQWPGYEMERMRHLPIPAPPGNEAARLNTLYWPTGASRWATFYALVGGSQAEQILTAVNTNSPAPKPLTLSDPDNGTSISPDMHMLGLRPVFVQDDGAEVWLLQLVDERYFWWTQQLTYTFAAGDSWTTLLTNLVTATGTPFALTVPTIPSAYGNPSPLRWSASGRPLPLLIDAAAMTVGLRFIRKLDGTVAYVNSGTASAADLAQYNANQSSLEMGGRVDVEVLAGNVPASVAVAFWGDASSVSTVTLASLALPDYGSITGVSNTFAWVAADLYAAATGADRTNYANQAATDYYGWLLSQTDATFRGVRQLDVTGQEDRIEWEYQPGRKDSCKEEPIQGPLSCRSPWERILTRIVRQNWGDGNQYGDRPPPGYVYRVKLTAQDGATNHWKSAIQIVSGGTIVDGPQLGFGADDYVLYASGTPVVNDIGTAVPDPLTPFAWLFVPSGTTSPPPPPSLPCEPHGWLLDRQALIDTGKYFDVQIFAGNGRCACINDQGRDPETFPYPWQARYDTTEDTWLLMEKMATCCDSCVQLSLDVDETTGVMTGQLVGSTACDDSMPFTYDLVPMCSGRGFAVFGAAGLKLCNTVLDPICADDQCDNSFTILATCDCCNQDNVTCDLCCGCSVAPPFVLFHLSGFSDASLNTLWVLPYTGSCTWGLNCDGKIFAYGITQDGSGTHFTFTVDGVAVYELDIAEISQVFCGVNRVLARVSGDVGTTPASVTAEPWQCTSTTGCFGPSDPTTIYFQFHDCTFDAACLNGLIVPLTYGVGTGSCAGVGVSSWNGTFTDCTNGATPGYICIVCHDGADSTCPWAIAIDFKDHVCAGTMGIVSTVCDPFTMEVQFADTCFFGVIKGRFTLVHP